MIYSAQAHREAERQQCLRLVKAGPGWLPYVLDKAERLVKDDPTLHGGLVAAVEAEIGDYQKVNAARRAAKWMEG
jgi:hypothetical protein